MVCNSLHTEHYTKKLLMNQIIEKMATKLQYPEKSVFMTEVNTQNFGVLNWEHKKVLTVLYGFL